MENYLSPLDSVFHALADPTRRAVVQRLGQGPATVSDLAKPFPIGLPAFLKHLGVLETAGLIDTQKAGRTRTCTLQRDRLAQASSWFDDQRAQWASRYDNLDTLLSALGGHGHDH